MLFREIQSRSHGSVESQSFIRIGLAQWGLYLWALPTTLLGLTVLVIASSLGRIGTQIVDGVLEIHGGWIAIFLSRFTPLPGGASAMTLGHVVLGRDQALLDLTRDHERVHVRQCERWGPFFVPAYLLASAVAWLGGDRAYDDNVFEREAFGRSRI